jgi:hypothetical protein
LRAESTILALNELAATLALLISDMTFTRPVGARNREMKTICPCSRGGLTHFAQEQI